MMFQCLPCATFHHAPFLASFAFFFAASFCITTPTNVPTTPNPRTRAIAGNLIAQIRGGKYACMNEFAGKRG